MIRLALPTARRLPRAVLSRYPSKKSRTGVGNKRFKGNIMPVIDASYAWRLVRDACERGRAGPARAAKTATRAATAGAIRIYADGRWQAERAVDAEAARLFDSLLPVATAGPALVLGQLGQSLDGRIATASGHSHYVTGEAGLFHLHRLRALVDAVVVGAGTVAVDDPRLTVRHVAGRSPTRVVLDRTGRLPAMRRVFTDGLAPTLHVIGENAGARDTADHVSALRLAADDAGFQAEDVLAALAERGLKRVLIEGGGVTVSRFLAADTLDRLHVTVAPLLIGSGRPGLCLPEIERLSQARRPACRTHAFGGDTLFDLDLR